MSKPIVAIVGRPNVGKSTLFNRLLGERRAIVEGLPGTTRDRIHVDTSFWGYELTLVDSGGLEPKAESTLERKIKQQVEMAIAEADLALFLVDIQEGVMPTDHEVADILRRSGKPVVLVANKVDSPSQQSELPQFYKLGMGEPMPISAYHSKGIDELIKKVTACLPSPPPVSPTPEVMKIAIVGRPNVGKSLLINTLLGEERLIVHEVPGTTRDAVDTVLRSDDESIVLIDTAGIRRRGRIESGVEQYSLARTLNAIDRSDVALLLTDAVEGITAQDTHILGYIQQKYKGAVLIVNKWDLVENKDIAQWTEAVRERTKFMPYTEILFLSAKTGYGVEQVVPMAKRVYQEMLKHLPVASLDNFVKKAVAANPPPKEGLKHLKIFKVIQTGVNPPTFVFLVSNAKLVHFSYRRYLENKLRQSFGFQGTPIRLLFKSRVERTTEN